jgi:hypothetical protein
MWVRLRAKQVQVASSSKERGCKEIAVFAVDSFTSPLTFVRHDGCHPRSMPPRDPEPPPGCRIERLPSNPSSGAQVKWTPSYGSSRTTADIDKTSNRWRLSTANAPVPPHLSQNGRSPSASSWAGRDRDPDLAHQVHRCSLGQVNCGKSKLAWYSLIPPLHQHGRAARSGSQDPAPSQSWC